MAVAGNRDGHPFFCDPRHVPLYVYRCSRCGKDVEELQKLGAEAPQQPEECPQRSADLPCPLTRVMTGARHRFAADYSSDGLGGYTRQGDTMIRQVKGKNSTRYGEGV
jgi:DNA-directed RNA polymerase subunit RPC12/RpoP